MRALTDCYFYGILDTGYCAPEAMPQMLVEMLRGGVHLVQLRCKSWTEDRAKELARSLHPLSWAAGVPFVINDWPAVAGELGLEGAHIGQDDGSIAEARRLAGPQAFIGRSTHSLAQAEAAQAEGADCIGFGPLFATGTKPGRAPIGTDEIEEVHRRVTIPIYCIGGIKQHHITELRAGGAQRLVIVSGVLTAADPAAYTATCVELLGR